MDNSMQHFFLLQCITWLIELSLIIYMSPDIWICTHGIFAYCGRKVMLGIYLQRIIRAIHVFILSLCVTQEAHLPSQDSGQPLLSVVSLDNSRGAGWWWRFYAQTWSVCAARTTSFSGVRAVLSGAPLCIWHATLSTNLWVHCKVKAWFKKRYCCLGKKWKLIFSSLP